MRRSNALDLEAGVFTKRSPRAVALSLKRSAERSKRRKSTPFRSAMSMLTFYINRAGRRLSKSQRQVLERAKDELRRLYGKEDAAGRTGSRHGRKAHPRARKKKNPRA
jgi:translation initiation factor 2 alpha subunit (eIF-2alpha)